MPSYNIPESVAGVPLFVPEDNDQFEIDVGGMPNGDDCLLIRGDLGRDYKAYMPAPTLSPDVFRYVNAAWSMSFWVKMGNIAYTTATPAHNQLAPNDAGQIMFGAMKSTASVMNGSDKLWTISAWAPNSSPHCGIRYHRSGSVSYCNSGAFAPITPDEWAFVVIDNTAHMAHEPFIWVNNVEVGSFHNAAAGYNYHTNNVGGFFGIGSYSENSPFSGRDGAWRLGKLAFHDHVLTETERETLYTTMVG